MPQRAVYRPWSVLIEAVPPAVIVGRFVWDTVGNLGAVNWGLVRFEDILLAYFMVFLLSVGLAPLVWQVCERRLIVSPEGVEYHAVSFTVRVLWSAVRCIERRRYLACLLGHKLILDEPLRHKTGPGCLTRLPVLAPLRRRHTSFIPLGPTVWHRYGELEQDLRRYAPHLFDESPPATV